SFSIFHKFNIELDVFECFVKATFCNFSFVCYIFSSCNQTVASCECKVIPKVLVTFDVELRGQFAVARCRYKVMHMRRAVTMATQFIQYELCCTFWWATVSNWHCRLSDILTIGIA